MSTFLEKFQLTPEEVVALKGSSSTGSRIGNAYVLRVGECVSVCLCVLVGGCVCVYAWDLVCVCLCVCFRMSVSLSGWVCVCTRKFLSRQYFISTRL